MLILLSLIPNIPGSVGCTLILPPLTPYIPGGV